MALKTTAGTHGEVIKGRGASINLEGRFEQWNRESSDDGWFQEPPEEPLRLKTVIHAEHAKSGTKLSRGANFECLMSGTPIAGDYIKAEGKAGRLGARSTRRACCRDTTLPTWDSRSRSILIVAARMAAPSA